MRSKLDRLTRRTLLKVLFRKAWILTWDHIGTVILLNLFVSILAALMFLFVRSVATSPAALVLAMVPVPGILYWALRSVALFTRDIVLFRDPGFSDFLVSMKEALKGLPVPGIVFSLYVLLPAVAVPFYISTRSFPGYLASGVIFWIWVFTLPVLMVFLSGEIRGRSDMKKAVVTAFHLLFTEPRGMWSLTLNSLSIVIISLLTGFLLPGTASAMLLMQSTYGYLEKACLSDTTKEELLKELEREKEKTGRMTIKSFLMPWKN